MSDLGPVKREPGVEQLQWRLIAVSEAARKFKNIIVLETDRIYLVGRSRKADIHIASPFCSSEHCELQATGNDVIMRDVSTHGTWVNGQNFKVSRCLMSNGDRLGFGCSTTNKHINNPNDAKYHVYRLTNQNELPSRESIILLDSDDDDDAGEIGSSHQNGNGSVNLDDSEDECPSADEQDVKPDIHTLMRMQSNYEKMKIKEEVAWNCYEYDRSHTGPTGPSDTNNQTTNQMDDMNGYIEPHIYDADTGHEYEAEITVVEPPQKRQRTLSHPFGMVEPEVPSGNDNSMHDFLDSTVNFQAQDASDDRNSTAAPEYQLSDTTRKEKVKCVARSRGQQLSADMMKATQSKEKPNATASTASTPSMSNESNRMDNSGDQMKNKYDDYIAKGRTVDELRNDFISEITKWQYKWINDKKLNPLQYTMKDSIRQLDTDFGDLVAFQEQMKNFLMMETYSIIFAEYIRKTKSPSHSFTELKSSYYNPGIKRFVYQCFTKNSDCKALEIQPHDFAVCNSNRGAIQNRFLAYVTRSKQIADGWEFELQASPVDNNRNDLTNVRYIQVNFVANIQSMLEIFISLYELERSLLRSVFLSPSNHFNNANRPRDEFVQGNYNSIVEKMYEKCAVSNFGNYEILLLNGGVGTGKTSFIRHLLYRSASESFEFTNSILVCSRNNELCDDITSRVMSRIKSSTEKDIPNRNIVKRMPDFIARFGTKATMRHGVRDICVERFDSNSDQVKVVFTTLDRAVDLLHANRKFDTCIVDDASLCAEAELLPLFRLNINTLLLVGDESLQTSNTQNECCRDNGYSRSLFTRVIESYRKSDPKRTFFFTLSRQRRMLPEILSWPNKTFYRGKMQPIENPQRDGKFWPYTVFQVNTIEDIEVPFVYRLLSFCIKFRKPSERSYGLICGHPQSKAELEKMIKENAEFKGIEVSAYDSFQGREKDIIIMVALKPVDGFILFDTKESHLIAMTRAKQTLIVCGNFQHVLTESNDISSRWTQIITDAKISKRFFDHNGVFDEHQVHELIK